MVRSNVKDNEKQNINNRNEKQDAQDNKVSWIASPQIMFTFIIEFNNTSMINFYTSEQALKTKISSYNGDHSQY